MTHSPGPWKLHEGQLFGHMYIVDASGITFAQLYLTRDQARATGAIMVAAPDMLVALKAIASLGCVPPGQPERRMMDDAITKARGETP